MMNQQTRLVIGILVGGVGLAITVIVSLWLPALFYDANAADWLEVYAFWVELSVNLFCFGIGLFAMSMFKVNIDAEIKHKGRLEKMTIVAFLLDQLGYNTAEQFIKKHFKVMAEDADSPAKPKSKKEGTAA